MAEGNVNSGERLLNRSQAHDLLHLLAEVEILGKTARFAQIVEGVEDHLCAVRQDIDVLHVLAEHYQEIATRTENEVLKGAMEKFQHVIVYLDDNVRALDKMLTGTESGSGGAL